MTHLQILTDGKQIKSIGYQKDPNVMTAVSISNQKQRSI